LKWAAHHYIYGPDEWAYPALEKGLKQLEESEEETDAFEKEHVDKTIAHVLAEVRSLVDEMLVTGLPVGSRYHVHRRVQKRASPGGARGSRSC